MLLSKGNLNISELKNFFSSQEKTGSSYKCNKPKVHEHNIYTPSNMNLEEPMSTLKKPTFRELNRRIEP